MFWIPVSVPPLGSRRGNFRIRLVQSGSGHAGGSPQLARSRRVGLSCRAFAIALAAAGILSSALFLQTVASATSPRPTTSPVRLATDRQTVAADQLSRRTSAFAGTPMLTGPLAEPACTFIRIDHIEATVGEETG